MGHLRVGATRPTVALRYDPTIDPRLSAAAALRRLNHAMVAHDADDELLDRIARQATATAEIVEASPQRDRPVDRMKRELWLRPPQDGGEMSHFDECIVSGRINPMGIVMRVRRDGDTAIGTIRLGAAHEGAPARAHGGIVAAILDDIMGYVLLLERTPAYTGTLTIRFAAATPVAAPLVATGWLAGRDGRKLDLRSTLTTADGEALAEGTGVFVAIEPSYR